MEVLAAGKGVLHGFVGALLEEVRGIHLGGRHVEVQVVRCYIGGILADLLGTFDYGDHVIR